MPVRNGMPHLVTALRSLQQQTFSNYELIVINDDSSDTSLSFLRSVKDKRIKIISHTKSQGVTIARGEFIARMDADDISLPKRLAMQLEFFQNNPQIVLLGTAAYTINSRGIVTGTKQVPVTDEAIKRVILAFNPFIHPTVMIRKKILNKVGIYDAKLNGAEDYDLFLRITRNYQVANLPQLLLQYRLTSKGVTFKYMKHTERQALLARWKALSHYRYPWYQSVFLLKPLISLLIPSHFKKWFLYARS